MTLFSTKWSNRKATRKWRGSIQSQDQAWQAAEFRSSWPRRLWIAAASCTAYLAVTTAVPDAGCLRWRSPCLNAERPKLWLCILLCYQFTFTNHSTICKIQQLPQSSWAISVMEGGTSHSEARQRGNWHILPSARHPHLAGKAFRFSGPKLQWVPANPIKFSIQQSSTTS